MEMEGNCASYGCDGDATAMWMFYSLHCSSLTVAIFI